MKRILAWIALGSSAVAAVAAEPVQIVEKPAALPLALSDEFQFRKVTLFQNGAMGAADLGGVGPAGKGDKGGKPGKAGKGLNYEPMIDFETKYRNFGAISNLDLKERMGQYFTFIWRADRTANLTLRLEYRQDKLGPFIQAREVPLGEVSGSGKTEVAITGDDYLWDGRISSWRAVLVEDGRIVALYSSALWN